MRITNSKDESTNIYSKKIGKSRLPCQVIINNNKYTFLSPFFASLRGAKQLSVICCAKQVIL